MGGGKTVPVSSTKEKESNKLSDAQLIYASLSFALTVVVIGIPLWWKTTEVYRVPLPYEQVDGLLLKTINHVVPVSIVVLDPSIDVPDLWKGVLSSLSDEDNSNTPLKVSYSIVVREVTDEEKEIIKESHSFKEFDTKMKELLMKRPLAVGSVHLFVMPKENQITSSRISIGTQRFAIVINENDLTSLLTSIAVAVRHNIVKERLLKKIFVTPQLRPREQPSKESMRPIGSVPVLDILFSLIVSQPHFTDASWDMEATEKMYLKPFVEKLLPLTEVNIKSQILYTLCVNVKTKFNNETQDNALRFEQLPLIINPIEAKLGTQVSVNPTLNFVIYIPTIQQEPTQIYDEKGLKVPSNAFLSPQWGGFLIYNSGNIGDKLGQKMEIDMNRAMSVFIAQLRLLIGLPETFKVDESLIQFLTDPMGVDLEMDYLIRKRTQEQLSSAISSLTSLSQLLATISNIVITDEIGNKIIIAVNAIERSLQNLEDGHLYKAFEDAKEAFLNSEQAFFDPSLLAMLYFPNDQKYAVYIPLFLPVSLPVVMSFMQFWNYFKKGKEKVD